MLVSSTMKVGIYFRKDDVRVVERPVPVIGEKEVLVEVVVCGVCGSDIMQWYREPPARANGGINTGHEIAGRIVEVGEAAGEHRIGDRVVVVHHFPCLHCTPCREGNETACEAMKEKHIEPGGFSQYVRVFEKGVANGLFPIPESVSYEQASFVEPLGCVVRSMRKMQPVNGHTVLVLGSGLAGLLHIRLARELGAKRIYAMDANERRLEAAARCGADEMISTIGLLPRADRVFVCTGSEKVAQTALDSVARGGRILYFAADGPDKMLSVNLTKFWIAQPSIGFSYGAAPRDIRESMELISSHKICVDDLVTHRFGLDQMAEAFDLAANPRGGSLKVIIEPNGIHP